MKCCMAVSIEYKQLHDFQAEQFIDISAEFVHVTLHITGTLNVVNNIKYTDFYISVNIEIYGNSGKYVQVIYT